MAKLLTDLLNNPVNWVFASGQVCQVMGCDASVMLRLCYVTQSECLLCDTL